ncbi:MAG: gamma-glutamylcyclotransferase family protein [Gemmatimonadaceae bacterium]
MPTPTEVRTEHLFSYGTLQLESVQRSLFGRSVSGHRDVLPGFERALLEIEDPGEVAALGQTHHAMAKFTGRVADEIEGTALLVTMNELLKADMYEPPEYKRVAVVLRSGTHAWVYVDVAHAPTT